MVDWTDSMEQSFEFYKVNADTWMDDEPIRTILSCSISRDSSVQTLGSATIETTEPMDECYIRIYLCVKQKGVNYRFPLGTYIVQSPSSKFDGRVANYKLDAYTPLIELKEDQPPLGYSILKGDSVLETASRLTNENVRASVVESTNEIKSQVDFIANNDDTWLSFISDYLNTIDYAFDLDPTGKILFTPNQEAEKLQPVWTYNDDNSSILYPELTIERDLFDIPNVVEVIYSTEIRHMRSRVVNDNPNSPVSTIVRGREKVKRIINPDLVAVPTHKELDAYAEKILREASEIAFKLTYQHGYCPVRLNDCVRLNYERAGLRDVKAKVISQNIECTSGCMVEETAIYSRQLWR